MAAHGQSIYEVYDRVREAILSGKLPPGTVMSQVGLADELGTSRTPLREALRMLQGEGLVDSKANRRVRVAPMSPRDLEELCVMRVTLEAEALRLAVGRMTPEDLAKLERCIAEMAHLARARDYLRWTVPHQTFHRGLTNRAGDRVNLMLSQMFDHAERYRRLHTGRGLTAWATSDHRAILDACKAGDESGSAGALATHLARVGFEVTQLLEPGYVPELLRKAVVDAGGVPSAAEERF